MPTTITGNRANITQLVRTVTGATNASPIVLTTSAPHLFGENDVVLVASVGGNANANGYWPITVLSATTFALVGSNGSGAYTSGGTATDLSLTPQFSVPAAGEPATVASINVALQALADRTQFLMAPASSFHVGGDTYTATIPLPPSSNYNTTLREIHDNTVWCHNRLGKYYLKDVVFNTGVQAINTTYPTAAHTTLCTAGLVLPDASDIVEVQYTGSVMVNSASSGACVANVTLEENDGTGSGWLPCLGGEVAIQTQAASGTLIVPVAINSYFSLGVVPVSFQTRVTFSFALGAAGDTIKTTSFTSGNWASSYKVWSLP